MTNILFIRQAILKIIAGWVFESRVGDGWHDVKRNHDALALNGKIQHLF
jgi:hypothetical protein